MSFQRPLWLLATGRRAGQNHEYAQQRGQSSQGLLTAVLRVATQRPASPGAKPPTKAINDQLSAASAPVDAIVRPRLRGLPNQRHPIGAEYVIPANDRNCLFLRLRDEKSVKRIPMVEWQHYDSRNVRR